MHCAVNTIVKKIAQGNPVIDLCLCYLGLDQPGAQPSQGFSIPFDLDAKTKLGTYRVKHGDLLMCIILREKSASVKIQTY